MITLIQWLLQFNTQTKISTKREKGKSCEIMSSQVMEYWKDNLILIRKKFPGMDINVGPTKAKKQNLNTLKGKCCLQAGKIGHT